MKVSRSSTGLQGRSRFHALATVIATILALTCLAMAPRPKHGAVFPRGFLWGAATASQQVEGNNNGNDWHLWELAGFTANPAGWADDEYHRYPEDFDLARDIGHNATRLSLEWSRIEPSQGVFDETEIRHYRDVLQAARDRGLKTFVTIQHFTLPIWVAQQGSWLAPGIPQWYAEYVAEIVPRLGDLVDFWLTLNEPNVNALTAYVVGVSPPGLKDPANIAPVLSNMLKAHAAAYRIIHAVFPNAQVGFAHHMRAFAAAHWWNPLEQLLAALVDDLWNNQILRSIQSGEIHFTMPFLLEYKEKWPELRGALDFVGVNYYTQSHLELALNTPEKFKIVEGDAPDQWAYYPRGIYEMVTRAASFGYPVYVTENGMDDATDVKRPEYLCDHLREVADAIQDGVDVRGYIHWALLDNWEWVYGFGPRFGLIAVDYSTQERTVRPSAYLMKRIAETGSLKDCGGL